MGIRSFVKEQLGRRFTPPANAQPINQQALLAAMQASSAPQKDNASAFSPGSPLQPSPGLVLPQGPRVWQFPVGYNIGQLPRATEATSFETLRNLASLYDGVQLCKQVWFDLCSRLEIEIVPTDTAIAAASGDASIFADDIAFYTAWFEFPDRDEDLDMSNWLIKALNEQLDLDALAIYVRPDRAGRPYSLEIVSGETIKPLIDARGRKPQPPFPAYQQYWYGVPLDWYTKDQMIYHRETQRADSVYGLSRVERVIMRVNQALRKQNKDLSHFTEGNLPPGVLEMAADPNNEPIPPDQILIFQQIWDGLLSGNDAARSKLKVIPPGTKYTAIKNTDIMTPFDMFLLNTSAACFGLTMAELGFTENVNKSSGESQENVVYRRAMRPLMNRYAKLFTMVLRKYFKETRFIVRFKGYEEAEDISTLATAYSTLTTAGILGLTDAATILKLPQQKDAPYIGRIAMTKDGPIFLDDMASDKLRNAAIQAKLASFKLASQPAAPSKPKSAPSSTQNEQDESDTPDTENADSGSGDTGEPGDGSNPPEDDKQRRAEYRRWRECAIADVKAGKVVRAFRSEVIPAVEHQRMSYALRECRTVEDVKRAFAAQRAITPADTHWQVGDPIIAANLAEMQAQGVKQLTWRARPGCCDNCLSNDGKTVAVGMQFPSGAYMEPNHNYCECGTEKEM